MGSAIALSAFFVIIGLLAGWITGGYLRSHAPRGLVVTNFRGRTVPAVGGIVLITALGVACAAMLLAGPLPPAAFPKALARSLKDWPAISGVFFATVAGFFALGLIDDRSAEQGAKGLLGHLSVLTQGRVTSGMVKLAGGVSIGFAASSLWETRLIPALTDALLIAGTANFFNLLDLRPGRACKVFFVTWAPLAGLAAAATGRGAGFLPPSSAFAGAVVAWLPGDLGEAGVLGDSGSNAIGAVVGMGLALLLGLPGRLAALALLSALSLVSEKVSFSGTIERFRPLRWLDALGRPPD